MARADREGFVDPQGEAHRLADDPEAGTLDDGEFTVTRRAVTGKDCMHRSAGVETKDILGQIVYLSVGDQDGAGEAVAWNVDQRPV